MLKQAKPTSNLYKPLVNDNDWTLHLCSFSYTIKIKNLITFGILLLIKTVPTALNTTPGV